MTPGESKRKRTVRKSPAAAAAVPRGPAPSPDDEDRTVGVLLLEHRRLCQGSDLSGPGAEADPAGRVAALREAIGDRLARSEPGSKAARFLRGLRVLVEVEAIAPGHLDDLRREADGWWTPLSLARGTPGLRACERVALEYGVDTETMEGDVRLAEAVEVIAGTAATAPSGPC